MDVEQYLEIFIEEAKEHLQSLNEQLLVIEAEPENMDTINEIFRAAHSLKGMAGTMGYKRMQKMTHDTENIFSEIRSGKMKVTAALVDVLFQCLDALEAYLDNIINTGDEGTDDNEPIINKLKEILENGANGEDTAKKAGQEEKKEEAAAGNQDAKEDGFGLHYNEIPVDAELEGAMAEALKNGNVYGITVYVQESCILKAARAFLVFKAIEELGQILRSNPTAQDIEDEKFEFHFSMYISSEESLDTILDAVKKVSEIETAVGEKIEKTVAAAPEGVAEEAAEEPAKVEKEESKAEEKEEAKPQAGKAAGKAAGKNGGKNGGKPIVNRTVRVDIEKLDSLMNQVSELIIAKNSLVAIGESNIGGKNMDGFQEQIEYLERITTNLHESVMKVRMVPIESVVNRFPRMIRDLSKKLDKKMQLIMSGEETELDRTVIDEIGDPLQHLLRNSADHGLESAELRAERGKPAVGSIFLEAYQDGNNVVIEVRDDGNGIDVESVKNKAIDRGIITPEQAESMSDKEIIDLLFMPSFSMAKKISDISGRGVGLDVVKSNIEALGGVVEVRSVLGEGSAFIIRLPLTLAIIQALMVEIGEEKYAIALGSIQSIEDIPATDIKYVEAKEVINMRGSVIPIIRLAEVLDVPNAEESENLTVVLVKKGDKVAGLVVDNLIGQQEIVIKSLGKYINNTKIISGATILGDGEVALILDSNAII
jgi:two-component system chemotaxis sensor kinase CheA